MSVIFWVILFAICGIMVGSFCNVLLIRFARDEEVIFTPSHCLSCHKKLLWWHNIPIISFALLRRRCFFCQSRISWQYPLVEASIGFLVGCVGYFYATHMIQSIVGAICMSMIIALLTTAAIYDVRYMLLPTVLLWISVACSFLFAVCEGYQQDIWHSAFLWSCVSAVFATGFFVALSYFSQETWMGYGDAFLACVIGFVLGPIGTFLALLVAFCVGSVWGIGLVFFGKKTHLKTQIPFGPFLICGLFVIFFAVRQYPQLEALFF